MKTLWLVLVLLLLAFPAFAATGTATALYNEPTTNSDGTPLTDLAKTTVCGQIGTAAPTCVEVAATKPAGGGAISQVINVAVPDNAKTTVTYWVTATDTSGNPSTKSPTATKSFDFLPPGTINNFTIQ